MLGPARFDREVWKETQVKLKAEEKARKAMEDAQAVERQMSRSVEQESEDVRAKDNGVSWGIDMNDDDSEHDDQSNSKLSSFQRALGTGNGQDNGYENLDMSSIPEKYRKRYEKIMAKRYKLSNLQQESERISCKEDSGDGLTVGQTAQLAKNREREEILQREIVDRVMTTKKYLVL